MTSLALSLNKNRLLLNMHQTVGDRKAWGLYRFNYPETPRAGKKDRLIGPNYHYPSFSNALKAFRSVTLWAVGTCLRSRDYPAAGWDSFTSTQQAFYQWYVYIVRQLVK
ncbi:hypothetical protein GWK47_035549 [Chionoecetes opilio]|uniref:Uncharacterized protein n=1 Tax=Chionoecetes opilio TaxID=41210 RepID=A0A8J4YN56_CHIOP|nr:hypothetical protein GWK47_035549 [Chionoecetes opilio]